MVSSKPQPPGSVYLLPSVGITSMYHCTQLFMWVGGVSLCGASSQLFLLFRGNDALFGDYTDFKKAITNGVANALRSRYSGTGGLTIKEVHSAEHRFCARPAERWFSEV